MNLNKRSARRMLSFLQKHIGPNRREVLQKEISAMRLSLETQLWREGFEERFAQLFLLAANIPSPARRSKRAAPQPHA